MAIKKPQTFYMYDIKAVDQTNAEALKFKPRFFDRGTVALLSNAKVLETSTDTRGCWIYALWDSIEDFHAHQPHSYESVRLEQF